MKHRLLVVAIAAAVGSMSSIAVAESLEQSVATTMLNHPQIKEAYDLYLARTHQVDQALYVVLYMPSVLPRIAFREIAARRTGV